MAKRSLRKAEIYSLLRSVGISDRNARILVPIAIRESGGRYWINNAGLNSNGTVDHGLFQINDIWRNDPDIKRIGWNRRYDPEANARMAKVVLRKQGLRAWATYNQAVDDRYIGKGAKGWRGGSQHPDEPLKGRAPGVSFDPGNPEVRLSSLLEEKTKPQATPLESPGFSASRYVRQGVPLSTSPPEKSSSLDQVLAEISDSANRVSFTDGSKASNGRSPSRRGSGARGASGSLIEMFYDPGINLDNGQPTSPIGNPRTHRTVCSETP